MPSFLYQKQFIIILVLFFLGCQSSKTVSLNDLHSRLNAVTVREVLFPKSSEDIVQIVKQAKAKRMAISISGGRHAMGGQQFGQGTLHISMKEMNDVLAFDRDRGIVRVEAGIEWPKLISYLVDEQKDSPKQWGIIQKQTGADNLSLGGSLSANIHGRGGQLKPIIDNVESFTLVNAEGEIINVSRQENSELFSLVIGGYGLFGVIATVDLRLQPRIKLQRIVEIISTDQLPKKVEERLADGFLYGDFQYKTDQQADDFMKAGVFSTYKPVANDTLIPSEQEKLTGEKWKQLLLLAHTDKAKAFTAYSQYYLSTNGQIYWSDLHQMSFYDDSYEEYLKQHMKNYSLGSLIITEAYVPRDKINDFVYQVAKDAREHKVNIIYGTMRLIEEDEESFLAWAKDNYACVIFNLRVDHTQEGIEKVKQDFQRIIDRALDLDGSYFLTYHHWARKDQVLKAYPQFIDFLKTKLKYDPQERFQSEWYRFYKNMFRNEMY